MELGEMSLTPEQQEMKKTRALSEADLVKRGAEYEKAAGALNISREEENRLKLENQEVVAKNLKEYIKIFMEVVIPAEKSKGWEDKKPGYCFFNGHGRFYFIDNKRNWQCVPKIEAIKIASLRGVPKEYMAPFGDKMYSAIKLELEDAGFELDKDGRYHSLEDQIFEVSKVEKVREKKEFDI